MKREDESSPFFPCINNLVWLIVESMSFNLLSHSIHGRTQTYTTSFGNPIGDDGFQFRFKRHEHLENLYLPVVGLMIGPEVAGIFESDKTR
jgi:hypothetical protein